MIWTISFFSEFYYISKYYANIYPWQQFLCDIPEIKDKIKISDCDKTSFPIALQAQQILFLFRTSLENRIYLLKVFSIIEIKY